MPVRYDIASMVPQIGGGTNLDPINVMAQLRQQEMADAQMKQMELRGYYQDLQAQRAAALSERQAAESDIKIKAEQEKLLTDRLHRTFSAIPAGDQKSFLSAAKRFEKDDPEFASWLSQQEYNEDLRNRLTIPAQALAERKYEKGPEGTGAYIESGIGRSPQYIYPKEQARTVSVEGTARNPRSSAQGVGQFIDSTFIDTYRKTFPEQAKGLTDARILAQRGSTLSDGTPIEVPMLNAFTQENKNALSRANLAPTPGNTRLAHFLGAGGATNVLKAPPDTPVEQLVSAEAIRANPEVLRGKTAGQVTAWANKQMEGVEGETPRKIVPSRLEPLGSTKREGQDSAINFLEAIEYDPETGSSRPAELLQSVGGGRPTQILYGLQRAFGMSTKGTRGEARLSASQKNLLLDKIGGSLGGKSFTDEDRKFVMEAIGGLDDTAVPVGDRLSKFDEAVRMLSRRAGVPYKEAPQLSRLRNPVTPEGAATRGQAGGEEMVTIDIPGKGPHKFLASVADKVRAAIAARGGR